MLAAIRWICLLGALCAGQGPAAGADRLAGPYAATVVRVVDGDTLSVRVAVWLGQELSVLIRIRGIDAPERRGRCAAETARAGDATAALQALVADGDVTLTAIEGGKYFGRVVADVTTAGGTDVATALIAGGFARTYDGGARGSWCEPGGNAGAEQSPRTFGVTHLPG